MRTSLGILALLLAGSLAGCSSTEVANDTPATPTVDPAKLAEARRQFSAFLEEAGRGAALLDSHPDRQKLQEEVDKLAGLLRGASAVYPENPKMAAFADDARQVLLRYFDDTLGIAKRPLRDTPPAVAKKRLDWTCDENARVIRKKIERMKADLVEPPPEQAKSPAKAEDNLSAEKNK
jgi:hypothetical protein